MKIEELEDLKQLIKLCRSTGVTSIKVDGIELELGSEPLRTRRAKKDSEMPSTSFYGIDERTNIPQPFQVKEIAEKIATSELTDEELLFYSAEGQAE